MLSLCFAPLLDATGTVMLIGAGIGLTPCSSILSALLKFRWKKNFRPEILHFYWVVRQSDVDGFQWFIRRLTELEHGLKRDREQEQVDRRYYAEINIFVTGAKEKRDVQPMRGGKRLVYSDALTQPSFADEDLYAAMLNPTVGRMFFGLFSMFIPPVDACCGVFLESHRKPTALTTDVPKRQVSSKEATAILGDPERAESAPNRFQDIFVWNGRPIWSEIFAQNA
eukprot:scaffold7887_cov286-Pinguiococcus_pyrenoidosus.AAC.1